MSKTETILRIKTHLHGLRNRYRCGDCLADTLHIAPSEIEDAIVDLSAGDEHILVAPDECGQCNERKVCLIMR